MHLFYVPELDGEITVLPAEESHHALHVLRLTAGTRVGLIDGRGIQCDAEVLEVGKRQCSVRIISSTKHGAERGSKIHLAVAPTKQAERFEWFLEKAVEIGVDRITPVSTARTERRRIRHDRALRVMIAAMKQSQRCWLPLLDPLTPIEELAGSALPDQRYFGLCDGKHVSLGQAYDPESDAIVVIGPEGDFSIQEVELLGSRGFRSIELGGSRLRTETAALAACTWMSLAQQR